ncbi:MAG: thermonuclease family protein [bacterium]|nr:thermonuclease family protein [bacterium]
MLLKRLILICWLLLIATATGCSAGSKVAEKASPAPVATSASETKPIEEKAITTPKEKTERYQVTRIIDGDTIEVEIGGQKYKVRYIGINTPEINPVECFGKEATEKNRQLVEGQKVRLEKDVSETDKYGRLLRYAFLEDGTFINETLVRTGYAHAVSYPPDVRYQKQFLEAERDARNNNRGLWSDCQGKPAAPKENQSQCVIKGNISSAGEKIYHIPGCPDYENTVINLEKGERWFCTEEEAISAGWRKSKNCP